MRNQLLRRRTRLSMVAILALALLAIGVQSSLAVPPAPELLEQLKANGQLQKFVDRLQAAKAKGVCAPDIAGKDADLHHPRALSFDPQVPDTFRALVILVDFDDNPATGGAIYAQPVDFEDLLFTIDSADNHFSMSEFYIENSYGNFTLKGDVIGWLRMPQLYSYYVDGVNGFGAYPNNAQRLAEDAITAADPLVNFADYDADNNGTLDGVFIVHAGPGAEQTGSDDMIWSHKWNISTKIVDGVQASGYTMEPEEYSGVGLITMGVFAHEYGHFLGLPDLYDTDYSSSGLGNWSLMAGGSWNLQGRYPAGMDAWCKKDVGFLTPVNITSNMTNVAIPTSTYEPIVYRLWANGVQGNEYFLIENRQKSGIDRGIPSSGLAIYHVNESIGGNNNEPNYKVALEQADGLFQLEAGSSSGDGGDLWSTNTKTHFDDLSTPSTRTQLGAKTKTAVWDISAPDSVMYASFDINYSRPRFELQSGTFSDADFGNNNGYVEIGETIAFRVHLTNLWQSATNVTATMWSDNPDINFTTASVNMGTISGEGGTGDNDGTPIVFEVPANFAPCIDSFFVEITSDNPNGSEVFGFELHVGQPNVLLVDGDAGDNSQQTIATALFDRRTPYDIYDRSASGPPSASLLNQYETVIWSTGSRRPDVINSSDRTALSSFLNNGGNLFFNSQSAIGELSSEDPIFLSNYFRVNWLGRVFTPVQLAVPGAPVHGQDTIIYQTGTNQDSSEVMKPVNGAVSEFSFITDTTAISYDGTYKLVLWGFGFEAINGDRTAEGFNDQDTLLAHVFNFFYSDTGSMNPTVRDIGADSQNLLYVTDHTPTFYWSVDDTTAGAVQQYEVTVGVGNLCSNYATEWASGVMNGSDTSITYAGLPLEDGQWYVVRVRVNNGTTWSSWSEEGFRMNTPPTIGYVGGPKKGEQVFTLRPTLSVGTGGDADGTYPKYEFEVYSDNTLTTLVTGTTNVNQSFSATTSWKVNIDLNEDTYYYWRARTNDGYETSSYTPVDSFVVNASNQAPNAFSLLYPVDDSVVTEAYPRLHWQKGTDNDPGDSLKYTLYMSPDMAFATYDSVANWPDTFRTLSFPVDSNDTFYWKVKALDRSNAVTWSSETFAFHGPSSGCCIGMRGDINGDGVDADPVDLSYLVDNLFSGGPGPSCAEEGDINGDGSSADPVDLSYLVDNLFSGGAGPVACP